MKILVTGSSGTIGTRLCEKLMAAGHDVTGVDWRPNAWQPSVDRITIRADLRNAEELQSLPSDVEVVVHLAANARVYELVQDPARARDNMLTVFNVLEYARQQKIPRFLFASSRECYGNAGAERYTEDMVRIDQCESAYTASKLAGEALVHAYRRCYGMRATILRFSNVYGMYDDSDRAFPLFIRQAFAGKTMTVYGEGKVLDFTYIDDTVQGILLTLEKAEAVDGETLNIAYGEGNTITRLVERIKELTGSASDVVMAPPRTGEVTKYVADITRAKELLGYAPTVDFETGVEKTVSWYRDHGGNA